MSQIDTALKLHRNELELQERAKWERARMVSYWSVIAHVKSGTIKGVQDIVRFSWEQSRLEKMKKQLDSMYNDKRFPKQI